MHTSWTTDEECKENRLCVVDPDTYKHNSSFLRLKIIQSSSNIHSTHMQWYVSEEASVSSRTVIGPDWSKVNFLNNSTIDIG